MTKCSHCGIDGHNSRTCNGKECVKLFGVTIKKRSFSTGDLERYGRKSSVRRVDQEGYNSDEYHLGRERSKGKPWTEQEHRNFLAGLMRQGRGNWRGISRNFVPTRTPTQIASHAQKYYMRKKQSSTEKKKRRLSVFDMTFPGFGCTSSSSVALKNTVGPRHQNNATSQMTNRFPYLTLKSTPTSSTMAPPFPYSSTSPYMAKVPEWTTNYMMPNNPNVAYNNGGMEKLSTCAVVHPDSIFPKPPIFPPSTSTLKGLDPLELGRKVGQPFP